MRLEEFIFTLNKVCKEENKPVFIHRTKFSNLKSILEDGCIVSANKNKSLKLNYEIDLKNFRSDMLKKYYKSIFLSLKTSEFETLVKEYENSEVLILINPYDIDEKDYKNSFFCYDWNYGIIHGHCRKFNETLNLKTNLQKWSNFINKKYMKDLQLKFRHKYMVNEVIFRNQSEKISIKNSSIVIIHDNKNSKLNNEIKNLSEKYFKYDWIFVNS